MLDRLLVIMYTMVLRVRVQCVNVVFSRDLQAIFRCQEIAIYETFGAITELDTVCVFCQINTPGILKVSIFQKAFKISIFSSRKISYHKTIKKIILCLETIDSKERGGHALLAISSATVSSNLFQLIEIPTQTFYIH